MKFLTLLRNWIAMVFLGVWVLNSASIFGQATANRVAEFVGPVSVVIPLISDDQVLVVAQNEVLLLDTNGHVVKRLELEMRQVTAGKIGANGKTIWFSGGNPGESGQVTELDLLHFSEKQTAQAAEDVFTSIELSADGKSLLCSSMDSRIYLFSTRELVQENIGGHSEGLENTDAQKTNGKNRLQWRQPTEPTELSGHSKAVSQLALMDDGQCVSVAEDMSVRLWDWKRQTLKRSMNQHVGSVSGVCVLSGAQSQQAVVATWGKDRTVRFWQPTIGRMMRFVTLDAVPICGLWSEETQRLFVGDSDGVVHRIDWQTGKLEASIRICDDWISSLSENSSDGTIWIGTLSGELWKFK